MNPISLSELRLTHALIEHVAIEVVNGDGAAAPVTIAVADGDIEPSWIQFTIADKPYAIWRSTGALHEVGDDGAVGDDPVHTISPWIVPLIHGETHPIRKQMLIWLAGKTSGSPVEFCRYLNDPDWSVGALAYHFRVLYRDKKIRLARTRPVRGASEHFYALVRPRKPRARA